ncbi:uridine kinase [Actinoplanes sp. NPDC051470]|uniref:uridine kinase n=1 Tax=Actinoplanes sp. NPDC051470 TaxID=3157224 RepID=UPI0034475C7E
MRVRPVSPEILIEELADHLAGSDDLLRVAVDGAPAARPEALADALVDPLRLRGRPAVHVRTADFLRPASLRFELGRTDPDSFYSAWVDEAGLRREVLDPAGPGGTGKIITRLWNADTDRAAREPYADLPARAVVIVSGALLLGAGLPFDLSVHLELSPAALARRTDPAEAWTLPAYARYAEEVDPASFADFVVRMDHPTRPALVLDRF